MIRSVDKDGVHGDWFSYVRHSDEVCAAWNGKIYVARAAHVLSLVAPSEAAVEARTIGFEAWLERCSPEEERALADRTAEDMEGIPTYGAVRG